LVEEKEKELKEKQDTISALSFTPQSKMGKMLMAKCRTLQEENEEIGNQASEGKVLQPHLHYSKCYHTSQFLLIFSSA
jgi:pre-mRNA-splicing regulator WTAP